MWIKDALKNRYINSDDFKAIEVVRIEAEGASPAYWTLRGILREHNEAVRLQKYRYEKQANEGLEILIARLNRELRVVD